jgi:hypothetical protein
MSGMKGKIMSKSKIFPERIVLATGYPWANGTEPYFEIVMHKEATNSTHSVQLKFPKLLWKPDVPKYRLVLERVKK